VVPKTCNQLNTRSVAFLPRCGPGRVFTRSAQGTPRRSKARACRPWGKTVTPVSRLTVRMHPPMHLRMVIPAMGQKSHTGSGPCLGLGARPWQMAAHTIDPEAASPPCTEVPLDYVYRGARWKSRPRSPCTSRSRGLTHDCSPREPPSAPAHGAVGAVFAQERKHKTATERMRFGRQPAVGYPSDRDAQDTPFPDRPSRRERDEGDIVWT
jgi:hypothetical protein